MKLEHSEAVSSVVGTVLLLAITVVVFSGVAIVVLDAVDDAPVRGRSDISVVEGSGGVYLRHLGGPALQPEDVRIRVTVNGVQSELNETQMQTLMGDRWHIGQSPCVSCLFPQQVLQGVIVIHHNALLLDHGVAGAPAGTGGTPDLTITQVGSDPMAAGQTVTFDATVANVGNGTSWPHQVRFQITDVDAAMVVHDTNVSGLPLASGDSQTLTEDWVAVEGNFTITVTADAAGTLDEADETNNTWTSGVFSPLPAGSLAAYQDNDNDGTYTPGIDDDIAIAALSAADCADGDCNAGDLGYVVTRPGAGLVVPTSTGTVTSDGSQDIYFEAPGDIRIHADLQATSDDAITLRAGGAIIATGQGFTNGQGNVLLDGGAVDLSGSFWQTAGNTAGITVTGASVTLSDADLRTGGNNGAVAITSNSTVVADGATLQAKAITVTAPAGASIDQAGLRFFDAQGSPHTAAENSNLTCLIGTLGAGAWATEAAAC